MTNQSELALQYAHQNQGNFLEELKKLIAIPSISTDPEHKKDMISTAEWLSSQLIDMGFTQVQVIPTDGHPVVFGEYKTPIVNRPTVLIYGHYDVQPVDPIELWNHDPFSPTQDGDHLFARGASDMKGQIMASIDAIKSVLHAGDAPVNIKFMIEGEEEIGSPSLGKFLRQYKDLLTCDVVLNPDAGMLDKDVPTIVYGLRGLAYFEIRVYGPERDLHSGLFGGVVHNPANALCELIAGMHDSAGKVTLPGFYDRVKPLSREERAELARLPINDQYYLDRTGAPVLYGEDGYTPVERVGGRPTLDVNGFLSGFTGKGSKTVIPAWAMAKVSTRLVPDQDPKEVYQSLIKYMEKNAPETIRWEIIQMAGGPASMTNRNHPATQALFRSLEKVWGIRPVYKREGGSIPIVADMLNVLGVESVLTGFGLPDDNIHSPNEKLDLPTWYKGIDALIRFFYEYGEGGLK